MSEPRICVNCGNEVAEQAAARCPQCGSRMTMLTVTGLVIMGWVFAVAGGFITLLMALVLWGLSYLESTSSAGEAAFELWLFSLVIALGLFSLGTGVWMINRRTTNKFMLFGVMGLLGLLVMTIFISNMTGLFSAK